MKIRLRTKKLISAGVIGASAMLIISLVGGYFYYTKSQERELALQEKYRAELAKLNETALLNEEGYALKSDVARGEQITEDMLEKVTLVKAAKSMDAVEVINVNTVPHFARTDLQANTVLVGSMIYEEEALGNDVREGEYSFIDLPTKLKKEDFVDIRIQFPNGDDYVLLSKKHILDTVGVTVWFNMDEGEQLTMSSAIVDAFVEEAKIYAMPYVDGPMQVASQMTYPVKKNVLELIKDTPNIVNIAKLNLESQNRARLDVGLAEMDDHLRQKLRQGEAQSKSEREQSDSDRDLNALNQMNEKATQEEIIGGQSTEGEGK